MEIIDDYNSHKHVLNKKNYYFAGKNGDRFSYKQLNDKNGVYDVDFDGIELNGLIENGFVENDQFLIDSRIRFDNLVYANLIKMQNTREGFMAAFCIRNLLNNNGFINVRDKEYLDSIGYVKDRSEEEDKAVIDIFYDYTPLEEAGIFAFADFLLVTKDQLKNHLGLSDEQIDKIEQVVKNRGYSMLSENNPLLIKNIAIYEENVGGLVNDSVQVQLSYETLSMKKRLLEQELAVVERELHKYKQKGK